MKQSLHRIVRVLIAVSLVAAIALLFGCAKAASTASDATDSAEAAEASGPMTVEFLEPTADSEVAAGTIKAAVKTSGIKFTMPSNTNVAGEGHVHFTLDDRPFVMSTEPEVEIEDVTPGAHTLKAELVQNNTQPFSPPVEQVIEFTAK